MSTRNTKYVIEIQVSKMGTRKFETQSVFVGNLPFWVRQFILFVLSLERIKILVCSQHLVCTVGAVTTVILTP